MAVLARVFGDIDIAEEAVQEAFATAVARWPDTGLPPAPAGWVITTARNRAIDRLRREASRDDRHAPSDADLPERLASVPAVVQLIFNEGYAAGSGEGLIREELATEAIRLGRLLAELMPDEPELLGLLALMLLLHSRGAARTTIKGELVPLPEQNRGLWDHDLTEEGQALVQRCLRRNQPGPYQLQAAINAVHSDALTHGPRKALELIDALPLDGYYLYHAIRADLLRRLGQLHDAAAAYYTAIDRTDNATEIKVPAEPHRCDAPSVHAQQADRLTSLAFGPEQFQPALPRFGSADRPSRHPAGGRLVEREMSSLRRRARRPSAAFRKSASLASKSPTGAAVPNADPDCVALLLLPRPSHKPLQALVHQLVVAVIGVQPGAAQPSTDCDRSAPSCPANPRSLLLVTWGGKGSPRRSLLSRALVLGRPVAHLD